MNKKIVLSADRAGFSLKEEIKKYLQEQGYAIKDVGMCTDDQPVFYYDAAKNISKEIQAGNFEFGIVFCGTGMGVAQVCNKFRGIFCACAETTYAVKCSRIINGSNILALGGMMQTSYVAKELVDAFLSTGWGQGQMPERAEFLRQLRAHCESFGEVL